MAFRFFRNRFAVACVDQKSIFPILHITLNSAFNRAESQEADRHRF